MKKVNIIIVIALLMILAGMIFWWASSLGELSEGVIVMRMLTCYKVTENSEPEDSLMLFKQSEHKVINFISDILIPNVLKEVKINCFWFDPDNIAVTQHSKSFVVEKEDIIKTDYTKKIFHSSIMMADLEKRGMYLIQTYINGKLIGTTPFFVSE